MCKRLGKRDIKNKMRPQLVKMSQNMGKVSSWVSNDIIKHGLVQ